jgi:SNF2 family DNA or RNA helicase
MLVAPKLGTEALFPSAPAGPFSQSVLGASTILLPHNVANTILLRKLGHKVPSPIRLYYDFPHPVDEQPFETQLDACEKMSENPHFYNLSDMGTGKTRTALWAWDYLNKTGMCKKLLVVAPLSTLHFTWAAEVFKLFGNGVKVAVLHGTKKQRLEKLASDADVLVINHDGLRVVAKEIESRKDIDCLVIDELAVYRNNSDRSKHMRRFAQRFGIVWAMTGSPMPQAPTDIWAQAKIVTPNSVPKYFKAMRDILMVQISQYKWVPRPDAVEHAFQTLQPSVRYSLDDVAELPETIYRNIDVELSPQQTKVHKKIKAELAAMVANKQITAVNAGVALNKILQIDMGWCYTQNPQFVRLDAAPRIAALITEIESAAHKVIVFVPWRHAIEGVSDIFTRLKVSFDHAVVHGDTQHREDIFGDFQNTDRYKVLLAHPKVVHHGITLTAADTIIWAAPTLSNEIYLQANARIIRVGQKHRQQILHMQATREEKRCYQMLRTKSMLQDTLLALLEEATNV